jgi:alkylhydroperoxidase family enzyme
MFHSVPLPKDDQLPKPIREALTALPPLHIFRLLATMPAVFQPYIDFAKALYNSSFDRKLRQIAMLRAAYQVSAPHLIAQYRHICKSLGVTNIELDAIQSKQPVTSLDNEVNFLCKVADELAHQSTLSNDTFQEFYTRYPIEAGTEFLMIICAVSMMGRLMNATRLELEKSSPLSGEFTFFPEP